MSKTRGDYPAGRIGRSRPGRRRADGLCRDRSGSAYGRMARPLQRRCRGDARGDGVVPDGRRHRLSAAVAVSDTAEYDAFYKRLIAVAPMKNVSSRFAMERIKDTTAYPLHNGAFRDRRASEENDEE
jgi:hypothetical protein